MTIRKIPRLLAAAFCFLVQHVGAAPIAYVSFEDAILTLPATSAGEDDDADYFLYNPWNGFVFTVQEEGWYPDQAYYPSIPRMPTTHAWISDEIANEGQKSLGIRLDSMEDASTGTCEKAVKQRLEFEIAKAAYAEDHDPLFHQHFEDSRYYGVALYIHPWSEDVNKTFTFMQAWQSSGGTPPFALQFVEGPDYKWRVRMANDSFPDGTVIYTSSTGLAKGVWHEFIVWFKPSKVYAGAVKVWHNGTLAVSQTSNKNFGYSNGENEFRTRFGAYRGQDCPGESGDIILFFDQAKYGTSYEDVDP